MRCYKLTVQFLYSILNNIDVIIVKNGKDIFKGVSDNIPLKLMSEWVDRLETDHDDLVIILK